MEINSIEDWWAAVDEKWPQLLNILERFLPMDSPTDLNGMLIVMEDGFRKLRDLINHYKHKKDKRLARYFEAAWERAPDAAWIHKIPAWGSLRDLCSEVWVFEEQPNEAKR